ncbi:tRNA uracil 4-sulfurtransferase ThiI [Mycobacterium avium]|uniref:tRNA uracil 4-sulfurtransferase ThiI n=2 Tax=Mycobacterium avium TaxID=1764 RepID=UPI00040172C0|nr:tRNA uracil 4-sulfurtransferase ThiI [Mycobacterium avium]KBR54760.1 tRNA sulfurtransferase ThiI [Mycobacterium avium XTB13-223]MCA4760850.1 tRNA 4-thiouridine(8) synthase ThiI [Mycobacterium avium subsp. hominissuis]MDO2355536.1 tRNA uracil 4-sulfurtransferase ThiI [Mycobacterium avium subsp. hominissuis]MDV3271412.1 tRNA 4-thiouridine(8) synthase ThiI [Mycobacterium avium]
MHMQCCVLLKYGEMVLKGGNRRWFEQWLLTNLDDALSAWPPEHRPAVRRRGGVLVLFTSPELQDELVALARNLIGISLVQPVWRVPRSARAAETAAVELLRDHRTQDGAPTFAVRCHRRDKRFGLSSEQLAARIGARVRADLGWRVDLSHPELELTVEVDRREIFLGTRTHPGQGGLPVGSSGRAVVLLSGGFDSPVAAYRAMRRGLACDFLHCTGAPFTDASSTYKAYALVRQLTRFQPRSRLYVAAVGRAQRTLAASGAGEAQIVAQRRLYLRLACGLAERIGAQAVVTGDSLGQVASQTLPNLAATEQAATLPVLRPLLGFDKQEILAEARRIGTAEIAMLPDQDCCQLFLPRRVATHAAVDQLLPVEARAGVDTLVGNLLDRMQRFDFGPEDADVESAATTSRVG